MKKDKANTPPDEEQVVRVLDLFKQVTDPYQRGRVIGKLETLVEQAETRPIGEAKTA